MSDFYCFHCQKEVRPKKLFNLRFCPYCRHKIIDSGEGLYLICDNCGADNPVNAKSCIKCGCKLADANKTELDYYHQIKSSAWLQFLLDILIVFAGFLFLFFILYISFYLVLALCVLGIVYYLFSKINSRF